MSGVPGGSVDGGGGGGAATLSVLVSRCCELVAVEECSAGAPRDVSSNPCLLR
eukprot:COSAG02_NODE_905_length_16042_cov_60.273600_4_plen_53_part_00